MPSFGRFSGGLLGGAAGGDGNSDAYQFPSFTGNDDTVVFNEFLADFGSMARAEGKQLKLTLPKNQEGLIRGGILRSNLDIDLNGSELIKIANNSGNMFTSETTAVLRTGPWQKTGDSWYGQADNITIRNGVLNSNNKWALAVACLFSTRNFRAHNIDFIGGQWNPQWAIRGSGRNAKFFDCKVLGQSRLFQDAGHWSAGDVEWNGCHFHGGDDCYAAGGDAPTLLPMMDDEALTGFALIGCTGISTRGAFLKSYRAVVPPYSASNGYTKTRYVSGVKLEGCSGKSGLLRNGGIAIFDHAPANSRTTGDLKDVTLDVSLDIGTDGTGVWCATSGTLIGSPTSVTQANPPVVTLNGHGLAAGRVVHFIVAKGGMHNLGNFYQVRANNLTADTFELSENPYITAPLQGSGFAPWTTGQLFAASSGNGYEVGQDLPLSGGTYKRPAVYRVTQVGLNGEVEAVRRIDEGEYSVLPPSPNSPTGGTGTGCQLWLQLEHDGVNAYGSHMVNAQNVTGRMTLNINDTSGAATRFRSFEHTDCEGLDLEVHVTKVPALGGWFYNESNRQMSRRNKLSGHMVCNGALSPSFSPVMLHGSEATLIEDLAIDELPSNTIGIQFSVGGGVGSTHNIASISDATWAALEAAHPGWRKGAYVEIIGNTLSSGSLNGRYTIGNTFGSTTLFLLTLEGAQVSLGGAAVLTPGQIRLINNTARLENVTVRKAAGATGTVGVDASSATPPRLSRVVIEGCDFSGVDKAIGDNVQAAPCGYVSRDNRT